jgi:hypothetical protein
MLHARFQNAALSLSAAPIVATLLVGATVGPVAQIA